MFRCNSRVSAAIVLGFTLFAIGCTSPRYIPWASPGVSDEKRVADFSDCQAQARQDTQRSYAIDTDIAATHAVDWRNAGVYNTQQASLTAGAAEQSQQILASCMLEHGYRPTS